MSSDSFQLLGMAERGFLPACLARRSRYETPTLAIVLSSIGICALSVFDFRQVPNLPAKLRSEAPLQASGSRRSCLALCGARLFHTCSIICCFDKSAGFLRVPKSVLAYMSAAGCAVT